MNQWYDDTCKTFHLSLHSDFDAHSPTFIDLQLSYYHFPCHKKWLFIASQCRFFRDMFTHCPKLFWHIMFPHHSQPPSTLYLCSLASHISMIYDILGQLAPCPILPPHCHLFSTSSIYDAITLMRCNRTTNEEGL